MVAFGFFFFFQAEDGIRDLYVTGVQTCALPISRYAPNLPGAILQRQVLSPLDLERLIGLTGGNIMQGAMGPLSDRKSTRLNSSHVEISYAVFCLKKKKIKTTTDHSRIIL